jgi:hypothetical protein
MRMWAAVSSNKWPTRCESWPTVSTSGCGTDAWRRGIRRESYVYCGPVVNGVELDQPQCRTVEDCAKQILEEYRREVEKMKEPPPPPPPDPAEELLKE